MDELYYEDSMAYIGRVLSGYFGVDSWMVRAPGFRRYAFCWRTFLHLAFYSFTASALVLGLWEPIRIRWISEPSVFPFRVNSHIRKDSSVLFIGEGVLPELSHRGHFHSGFRHRFPIHPALNRVRASLSSYETVTALKFLKLHKCMRNR